MKIIYLILISFIASLCFDAMSVDNRVPTLVEAPGSSGAENENGTIRRDAVQNNCSRAGIQLPDLVAGKRVLKICAIDLGVVIDSISLP